MAKDANQVVFPVQALIDQVERELGEILRSDDAIAEAGVHLWQSGGKRLRPMLTLLSAELFAAGNDGTLRQSVLPVAVATELVHMATLVHDDILDQAAFRRSYPTINALLGDQVAVLAGDALLARALVLLAHHAPVVVVEWMSQMVYDMCEGEVGQEQSRFSWEQTEDEYRLRIEKKTGRFLAACCRVGAYLGGATPAQVEAARQFGLHLGLAFQMTDDILDITGDPAVMGKPAASDLAEGILTLPVLRALQTDHGQPPLATLLQPDGESRLSDAKVQAVLDRILRTDGVEYAQRQVDDELGIARGHLHLLPEGEARSQLDWLLTQMAHRRR